MVEDSLLQGMEVPHDLSSREICCLLGIHIWDIVEKRPRLIWPFDYYPLLLFRVGTNDTVGVT